jgi:trimethylamine:corrinoid methyltransferase-like protein
MPANADCSDSHTADHQARGESTPTMVLALTAEALYLLEFRYWLVGMSIGLVISCLPRDRLVACCRRRR